MLDHVLIESVGGELVLARRNDERLPRDEPKQKAFATAMRAITFDGLVNIALSCEFHGSAMTTSSLHYYLLKQLTPKFSGTAKRFPLNREVRTSSGDDHEVRVQESPFVPRSYQRPNLTEA